MECIHKYYIHNFKFIENSQFSEEIFAEGTSIYEVIRIEKSTSLFLENHLNRLFNSADLSRFNVTESYCDFETLIYELIKKNKVENGKIKIVLHYKADNKNQEKDILLYFTPHYFPSEKEYKEGINIGLCKAVRNNPNAKILNTRARQKANHYIIENKLFEVLLIDKNQNITEGSRSNIFFIKDDTVITSPHQDVLMGITRNNIINLCKKNLINHIERKVHLSELKQMDSAFISGTSLKVLPVKNIEGIEFNTNNKLLKRLLILYDDLINNYILEKKE